MKKLIGFFTFICCAWFIFAVLVQPKEYVPQHAVEYKSVPATYESLWIKLEHCSGLTGDFNRIHFYSVPGTVFPCYGLHCYGLWSGRDHTIFIARNKMEDTSVIEHEELHDLLGRLNLGLFMGHHPLFKKCVAPEKN